MMVDTPMGRMSVAAWNQISQLALSQGVQLQGQQTQGAVVQTQTPGLVVSPNTNIFNGASQTPQQTQASNGMHFMAGQQGVSGTLLFPQQTGPQFSSPQSGLDQSNIDPSLRTPGSGTHTSSKTALISTPTPHRKSKRPRHVSVSDSGSEDEDEYDSSEEDVQDAGKEKKRHSRRKRTKRSSKTGRKNKPKAYTTKPPHLQTEAEQALKQYFEIQRQMHCYYCRRFAVELPDEVNEIIVATYGEAWYADPTNESEINWMRSTIGRWSSGAQTLMMKSVHKHVSFLNYHGLFSWDRRLTLHPRQGS